MDEKELTFDQVALELILTYVPEAEFLSFAEAHELALRRDSFFADSLRLSAVAAGME